MCRTCAETMNWRFKTPITVVGVDVAQAQQASPAQQANLSDVGPLGVLVPPIGAAEALSPKGSMTDPTGSVGGAADTISNAGSGVASTAKSTYRPASHR